MNLTTQFKEQVRKEILVRRKLHNGSDKAFATSLDLNPSAYSRLKKGEVDGIISENQWLTLGRTLEIHRNKRPWKVAKTYVYTQIEDMVKLCKNHSQSKILVDDCGIGKSQCIKAIAKTLPNAVYIDCSQHKTKIQFIRHLAKMVGVDNRGKVAEVLENTKYYMNLIPELIIMLDEFGDMEYSSILLVKELWNATEGNVGWLMTGAEGLAHKINKGIGQRKVGYAELFSRFAGDIIRITPEAKNENDAFWKDLFTEVAHPNVKDITMVPKLVKKCMAMSSGHRKDLRFIKDLIIQNNL